MWPFDQIVDLLNQQRLTERDKDCIRQLVAQEVTLNFTRLMGFFGELVARRHRFVEVAPYLDTVIGGAPAWERVRWDGAPILIARSMTNDDLLRIGIWYLGLDKISQMYERIVRQGALLRASEGKIPDSVVSSASVAEGLQQVLIQTSRLVDNRRPFVHKAVATARHATHADQPVTTVVPVVDPEIPTIYRYDGSEWQPITAADIMKEYADIPMELRYT